MESLDDRGDFLMPTDQRRRLNREVTARFRTIVDRSITRTASAGSFRGLFESLPIVLIEAQGFGKKRDGFAIRCAPRASLERSDRLDA